MASNEDEDIVMEGEIRGEESEEDEEWEEEPTRELSEYERFLKDTTHLDAKVFEGHLIEGIIDEIALEGLDGITVQGLKVRLEDRPNFGLEAFEDIAPSLWKQLQVSKVLQFYVQPVARDDLILYKWNEFKDDRGNVCEPLHVPDEIYPYFPVMDKEKGIRGSCEHYHTRKNVTGFVRRETYIDTINLFGSRLVIVASQSEREKTLFGNNFRTKKSLSIVQYCLMERVGRARHSGEITRGKISLTCMKIQPKTLFYNRKELIATGLITRQNTSVKFFNCRCPAGITVFHLPRFYKRIETPASLNTRTIFADLNQSESRSVPSETIRSKYGKHTLRNLMNQFSDLVESAWEFEQIKEDDVDFFIVEDEARKAKPRAVRVVRLKETDLVKQELIIRKVLDGQTSTPEDDDAASEMGEQDEDGESGASRSYSDVKILRPPVDLVTRARSVDLFESMIRAGVKGLTLSDISFLSTTPLESRSTARYLTRLKAVKEILRKRHKQKVFSYVFHKFADKEASITSYLQEPTRQAHQELFRIREEMEEQYATLTATGLNNDSDEEAPPPYPDGVVNSEPVSTESTEQAGPSDAQQTTKTKAKKKGKSKKFEKALTSTPANLGIPTLGLVRHSIEDLGPAKASGPSDERVLSDSTADSLSKEAISSQIPVKSTQKQNSSSKPSEFSVSCPKPHLVTIINPRELSATLAQFSGMQEEGDIHQGILQDNDELWEAETMSQQYVEHPVGMDVDETETEVEASELPRRRRGDSIDNELLLKMTRQRVDWNEHDDKFILLAFIASALFIQKYDFYKVFIYNATQLRDLLIKKTEGKSTKTSLAIRRRIHFLMNQKSYYDIYIGLMGAALKDDELYETYVKKHIKPPQVRIYHFPSPEALEEVIKYLYNKFESEVYTVVDTKGSLNDIDTVLFIRQLQRMEPYWNAMMFVIFCPMGKTSTSRRRFRQFWQKCVEGAPLTKVEGQDNEENEAEEMDVDMEATGAEGDEPKSDSNSAEYDKEEEGSKSDEDAEAFPQDISGSDCEDRSISDGKSNDDSDNPPSEGEDQEKTAVQQMPSASLELDYCYKYLRFFLKKCSTAFGNMMVLTSYDKRKFALICFDPTSLRSNVCFSARECASESEVRLWTARTLVLDLMFAGDLSRSIEKSVVTQLRLPVQSAIKALRYARVVVSNKTTRQFAISRQCVRQFLNGLSPSSLDETLDFLKCIDEVSSIDSTACISSGILIGLVELSDYFTTKFTVTEAMFSLNDEWLPIYNDIRDERDMDLNLSAAQRKKRKNSKGTRGKKGGRGSQDSAEEPRRSQLTQQEEEDIEGFIECFEGMERDFQQERARAKRRGLGGGTGKEKMSSTNALRLLRMRLNEAGVQMPRKQFTGYVERDFFNVNFPTLEFVLPTSKGLNHKLAGSSHPFTRDFMKDFRNELLELVFHRSASTMFNVNIKMLSTYLGKYTLLFEIIDCAGGCGVSAEFLRSKFPEKPLAKGLRYLIDAKLVFSVGVTCRMFVTFNNIKDWIIPIQTQQPNKIVGHVVMRPWITAVGSLSWPTVNRLIIALLGQIKAPSVLLNELCRSLKPTLSPVEVMTLTEVLVKLNYLTLYKCREVEATAFSHNSGSTPEIEFNVDTLIGSDHVFVAVSPYVTFLQAQLQEAVLKAAKRRRSQESESSLSSDSD